LNSIRSLTTISTPCACAVVGLTLVAWQMGCSRSAQSYLERGNRLYSTGKYEEAALNYRNSIQRNPKFAEAHYRLALTLQAQRDMAGAYSELRRALEAAPQRDDIRIALADMALQLYNTSPQKPQVLYDVVTNTADYLLKKNGNSFEGLRLRADVLVLDGKLDEALASFRRAEKINPFEPKLLTPMVQVELRLNRTEEAEALVKQALAVHKDLGSLYDVLASYYIQAKRIPDAEALLKSKIANMPKDATPILQLASLYHQFQREQEMTQALQPLLNDPRNFPQGQGLVGDFYASIGQLDNAVREYQAGVVSNPKDKTDYLKKMARVLAREGKRDEAVEQLSKVLKEHPDDLDSRLARAIILRESNDPKKLDWAISELNAVLEKTPNDEIAHYNLGVAYQLKGDSKMARAQLMESARLQPAYIAPRRILAEMDQREHNYNETIRLSDEILALNPGDPEARLLHAAALVGNKAYQQARTELTVLLQQHPNSVDVNLHMAVLDMEEKRYQEAEARYKQLRRPGSNADLRPLEGLVQLYTVEKQLDKAIALLQEEVKSAPDSEPVHLLFASTATRAGKLDVATQQYQWLEKNDPNSLEVYESLASFYQMKGDIGSALSNYQRARELAPNDPHLIAIIAFLQNYSGKEPDAIANLEKQLAIDPENAIAMNNLAFMLADTDTNLDRALTLAQAAQRTAPNNPGFADTMGWVYVKKGLNDSAIQIFNALVKKYPDESTFRYHLGVALLQKGQTSQAKAEFVIGLSKNPPKEMAEKIKQILSKLG
jgi:tetratricopeptide (TPR) repeat protein